MKTSRLDEMIEWYGLVLGTQVQFRNGAGAWTSNDENLGADVRNGSMN
jgi:catechol 2,3-dioxygenase